MPAATPRARHPARLLEIEELFADPVFAGASISPDGTQIAYLAPAHGRMNVWVRGIPRRRGSLRQAPRRTYRLKRSEGR